MGAGASKSPIDIASKTINQKQITQEIFRYMITQMKFSEYLSLANPDQCKRYVVLIADSLQKFFNKIRITPDQKDGYIYFRKFDEVKGATPNSASLCMAIAYFYVRIFQIYGGLAISILDTNTSVYDIAFGGGLDELEDIETSERNVQRGGGLPYIPEEPLLSTDFLQGDFNELRPYLARMSGKNDYFKVKGFHIFIKTSPYEKGGLKYLIKYQYIKGVRKGTESIGIIEADLKVEKRQKTLLLSFEDIKITGMKVKIADSQFSMRKSDDVFGGTWTSKGKEIPGRLHMQFESILSAADEDEEDDNEDEGVRYANGRPRGERRPDRKDDFEFSDRKAKEPFQTFKLLQRLKTMDTQPIKAHCIARALQLVSSKGLQKQMPTTILSSACDSKFFSAKDKRYRESLPGLNEDIITEQGIYVLWQMFFDKILPDLSPDMKDSTKEKFKIASAYLAKAFQNNQPLSMKQIKSKTGSAYCRGNENKQLIVKDKSTIQGLRAVAAQMLNVQFAHTGKVMLIFKKLFLINPNKSIELHPDVLAGGIPAVDAIADQARALLVSYYSNCEALYASGLQVLEKGKAEARSGLF